MKQGMLLLTAGFLLVTTAASAQSLGDVAKREADRREAIASPGKVYTGDMLRPARPSRVATPAEPAGAPAAVPASQSGAQEGAEQPPAADEQQKPDEQAWRARVQAERDGLQRAQIFAEALQSRINALSTDFVARDDPAQRNQIATDRQKAQAEMERVNQEIQQHTKNIVTIQEEARRAGVPAGWVR